MGFVVDKVNEWRGALYSPGALRYVKAE